MGKPRCDPKRIIKHTEPRSETRYQNGDTSDIIETILIADAGSWEYVDLSGVQCLRGGTDLDTMHNIWAFVKYNLKYKPDQAGHEKIKKPGPLFTIGTGDCKSYSIAIGAILRALGYRYKYRFTAYKPGDVTHVYVVAYTNAGKPVILDAVHKKFNDEVVYFSKNDLTPNGQKSGSIAGISVDFSSLLLPALAALLLWNLVRAK